MTSQVGQEVPGAAGLPREGRAGRGLRRRGAAAREEDEQEDALGLCVLPWIAALPTR